MNQPVIQKNPVFTFEAEGEHILDKKKLNELVRQCCGGGPPGQDGNYLTPDVEEVCGFPLRKIFQPEVGSLFFITVTNNLS